MITYVYFIQQGYGAIKIGISESPEKRLNQMQIGNAKRLRILATMTFFDRKEAETMERELHVKLDSYHMRGEWFNRRMIRDRAMKKIFKGTLKNPECRSKDFAHPDTT